MIFLTDRDRLTQRTFLRDIHDRLANLVGCGNDRYRPSRRRSRHVIVDIDTAVCLGNPYEAENARLEVRFWYPASVGYEYYRINWIDPERNLMLGFHQDADHQDIGPCYIGFTYEDTPVDRHNATFLDAHSFPVFDNRLQQ